MSFSFSLSSLSQSSPVVVVRDCAAADVVAKMDAYQAKYAVPVGQLIMTPIR